MLDVLIAELEKCRRSKILLPAVVLALLSCAIGAITYSINASLLSGEQWGNLWVQNGLFYGYFFYPMMIAICASCLWRVEHREHNWNRLMTVPVRRRTLIGAKFIVLACVVLLEHTLFVTLALLCGKALFHIAAPVPPRALEWFLFGWLAALPIAAMQLYLSMRIRSFAVPIGIALASCVVGLGTFVISREIPYPNTLLIVGLGAQSEENMGLTMGMRLLCAAVIYAAAFLFLAAQRLRRNDIAA